MLSLTHYAQNYAGIICGSLAAGIIYTLNTMYIKLHILVIVISQAGVEYHCYYAKPRAKPEVEC